jgi:high-affinity iron transporter
MFANFLIGLREGLEAALVVGILVAYMVRTGSRHRLAPIWAGVAIAVVASFGVGALLTYTSRSLSTKAQETFAGSMSIVAVGFVTWMIFWMRRQARFIKGELHGKVDAALAGGAATLAVMAFVAVGREGLETAVFVWSAVSAAGSGSGPVVGAVLGLLTATIFGWLLYKGSVRINLASFFTFTGAALVVVAAGVLAYGLHDLQEASILPGLHSLAFDVSAAVPPSSWYGTVLKGVLNFSAATTWLQLVAYFAYLAPTLFLFFRPARAATPAAAAPAHARTPAAASR